MSKISFRHVLVLLGVLSVMTTSCNPSTETESLVTIDMGATYPKKTLVVQDFLDVEYVPLETNDEFVTQGDVRAVGEKYIAVRNYANDGDIYLFDRHTGKALKRINRKGQGGEEYVNITNIILDEAAGELYVNDSGSKRIQVYDMSGQYKRSLRYAEGCSYMSMYGYDEDYLIAYDFTSYGKAGEPRDKPYYHVLISKQDGSVVGIPIPFDKIKAPVVRSGEMSVMGPASAITPNRGRWLLAETSTDTVYNYTRETGLKPFIVHIPTSRPERLLSIGTMTDRYYFLRSLKVEYDFTTWRGFPTTEWVYDTQDRKVYEVNVLNGDFTDESYVDLMQYPVNGEKVAAYGLLSANGLVDAYQKGHLKEGPLKELAAKLEVEDNPVLMVMKYQ